MKAKLIIALILVFISLESKACLNFYYSVDNTGHLHEADNLQVGFNINFNSPLIEKKLIKLEKKLKKKPDYKLLSDYAVLLLKAGKTEIALDILEQLSNYYPNEYQIAANLGTAYELNGDLENAVKYISRGLELNPNSHEGSEWVHIKVLETKQQMLQDSIYLSTHSVLKLTEEQKLDSTVRKQILIQVRERFPFSPGPNPIMANILVDLGDCFANTASIEFAKVLYTIAQLYYGADEELTDNKIDEMVKLRIKYSNVRPEKRRADWDNMKISGISYKRMLDDNNSQNYTIKWENILTDADELLALANIERYVDKDAVVQVVTPVDSIAREPVEERHDAETDSSGSFIYYLLGIAFVVIVGLSIFKRRNKES